MFANLFESLCPVNTTTDISSNLTEQMPTRKTVFRLPIEYLSENTFPLNSIVSEDLELLGKSINIPDISNNNNNNNNTLEKERDAEKSASASRGMYEYLLNPQHQFALEIIPLWNEQYTTDISFLQQTQYIIQDISSYKMDMAKIPYRISCDSLLEIWSCCREDESFLEKYSYIEWDYIKYLNTNPLFLQSISLANIAAPVFSFLLPIMFLILPFIILKIQDIPIDIETYVTVLQDIAKHHFIGKAIGSMNSLNFQNICYLLFMGTFYVYSIYQNVIMCMRFYRNMEQINRHLYELQFYLDYSIYSIQTFSTIIEPYDKYSDFNAELRSKFNVLVDLRKEIGIIQPFAPSVWKVMELGELLRCYYILYSRDDFAEALQYSFGFEGYINNLLGLYENRILNRISNIEFDSSGVTVFENQYYAAHIGEDYVVNLCDFSQNMVITGPNAAGKTTFLKTSLMNVIFSQQFGCGFYSGGSLNPYTHIHSYLNIPDTSARDSLFQAESRRCKEIIDSIETSDNEERHLCTFDELYSGTNPDEATQSAYAFLTYLGKRRNIDFILTTHYIGVCERIDSLEEKGRIANYQMEALVEKEDIKYTYKLISGISNIKGAMKVLRDMEYPDEILDSIEK